MPETAGELVASNGEVLGRHEGISQLYRGPAQGAGASRRPRRFMCSRSTPQPSRDRGRG